MGLDERPTALTLVEVPWPGSFAVSREPVPPPQWGPAGATPPSLFVSLPAVSGIISPIDCLYPPPVSESAPSRTQPRAPALRLIPPAQPHGAPLQRRPACGDFITVGFAKTERDRRLWGLVYTKVQKRQALGHRKQTRGLQGRGVGRGERCLLRGAGGFCVGRGYTLWCD